MAIFTQKENLYLREAPNENGANISIFHIELFLSRCIQSP